MQVSKVKFYPAYNLRYGHGSGKPDLNGQDGTSSDGTALSDGDQCNDVADGRRSALLTIATSGEPGDPLIDMASADVSTTLPTVQSTAAVIDSANWDFLIIDNHNLDNATGGASTITLKSSSNYSDTVSLTSAVCGGLGSATEDCTVASDTIADVKANGILVATTGSTNANSAYKRVDLGDAQNFAADITIGEITMGKSFTTPFNPEVGVSYGSNFEGVQLMKSHSGQTYSIKKHGRQRTWDMNWNFIEDSDKTNFEKMFEITEGDRFPLHFTVDSDSATPTFYYGRFTSNFNIQEVSYQRYSVQISIIEEL
jgi:hypothetical protein